MDWKHAFPLCLIPMNGGPAICDPPPPIGLVLLMVAVVIIIVFLGFVKKEWPIQRTNENKGG